MVGRPRRIGQAGADILALYIVEIGKDFLFAHPGCEQVENVRHSHPRAGDRGPSATNGGVDRYPGKAVERHSGKEYTADLYFPHPLNRIFRAICRTRRVLPGRSVRCRRRTPLLERAQIQLFSELSRYP